MSSADPLAVLGVDQRNELEALLIDFDQNWTPNSFVEIARRVVSGSGRPYGDLALAELVKVDLQRSWSTGNGRRLEHYLSKFPSLGTSATVAADLVVSEYEARCAVDGQIALAGYESRFPNQFEQVKQLAIRITQSGAEEQASAATKRTAPKKTTPEMAQASTDTSRAKEVRATKVDRNRNPVADLPEQFGRYRILKQLGSGAMGKVYLAHDSQLDRQVAIKTPSFSGAAHDDLVTRFYREARSAAKLQHRNVCPIYDVGEIEGRHFISMAFIKGRCMSEYIKPGKVPPQRTSVILVQRLAMALAEAHRNNVIHRDLKPANIMIDLKKEPVVMDFGLARQTDIESRVTQSGMAVGTPAYMSPEQVRGEVAEIGPSVDIYALGVILYELLTGRLPFRGPIAKVVYGIVHEPPDAPSSICDVIDPELESICLTMMAKSRVDRYASMDDVASALKAYLQGRHRSSQAHPSTQKTKSDQKSKTSTSQLSETAALNAFFAAQAEADPRGTSVELGGKTKSVPAITPAVVSQPTQKKTRSDLIKIGLVVLGLLALLAGSTFLFETPEGTLRVEVHGDDLEVLVDGDKVQLTDKRAELKKELKPHTLRLKLAGAEIPFDPNSGRFVLDAGKLSVKLGETELRSQSFELARDQATVLRISVVPTRQTVQAVGDPADVAAGPDAAADSAADLLASGDYEWRTVQRLPEPINSRAAEKAADMTSDGLMIVFSSYRGEGGYGNADLWMATRPDVHSAWSDAQNLGPRINTAETEYDVAISPDGLKMVFRSNQQTMVSQRDSRESVWSVPEPFELQSNFSPEPSPERLAEVITQTYESPSGSTTTDLFLVERSEPGAPWSEPTRLPGPINTQISENSATLSDDGRLLIFHRWDAVRGGQTLWMSTRPSRNAYWSVPTKIDTIESPDDATRARILPDGKSFLYSVYSGETPYDELYLARLVRKQDSSTATEPGSDNRQPDWNSLFDGKTLDGWTVHGIPGWSVSAGVMTGATRKQHGWIGSDDVFEDFELELEYQLSPGSNSGIFLRAAAGGALSGKEFLEIQLLDDTAKKYSDVPPVSRTGSLYATIAANPILRPAPNEWHHIRVKLVGDQLQVDLNGVRIVDDALPPGAPTRGHIGLQLYPSRVQFRNIRLRNLSTALAGAG